MKLFFLFLVGISLLCSCGRTYNEPLNNQVSEYIRNKCQVNQPCKIQLKDATDFSWDKFVFFEHAVESDVISNVIGEQYSSSSAYYSRKWFFLKDNRVVRSEEHILYEVDDTIKEGDVDFGITDAVNKFAVYSADATFDLERNNTETGEYYRLHCTNCK